MKSDTSIKATERAVSESPPPGAKATDAQIHAVMRAAIDLVSIVEGIHSPAEPWRSTSAGNMRLKDSPVWAQFYVAVSRATKPLNHVLANTTTDPNPRK
jgi:hypothetical protein